MHSTAAIQSHLPLLVSWNPIQRHDDDEDGFSVIRVHSSSGRPGWSIVFGKHARSVNTKKQFDEIKLCDWNVCCAKSEVMFPFSRTSSNGHYFQWIRKRFLFINFSPHFVVGRPSWFYHHFMLPPHSVFRPTNTHKHIDSTWKPQPTPHVDTNMSIAFKSILFD